MAMGRPLTPLELSASDRAQLESMAHSRSLPHGLVRRAEIVLLAAEGWPHEAVAGAVGVTRATVGKGRQRFLENGLNGLYDERRSGAPRSITDEQVAEVVYKTLKTKPKDQTQWSVRSMGAETGLTKDAVHRIWRTYGLQPHRHKPFKLSTDPFLVDKVRTRARPGAVRGREESDPGVGTKSAPATPWAWATWKGLRTPTSATAPPPLFAALDVATGEGMTPCKPRHRHQEFLQFLGHIEGNVPGGLDVHLVVDHYATHKHAKVKQWLARRPRFHLHYTPTYASWLNQVEIWFNIITRQAVRRDSFRTVRERIERYTAQWNANAPPFVWTATVDSTLAKIKRLCERISTTKH